MTPISSIPEPALTSNERWRRWEQRGRDNDARFMRRLGYFFWSAAFALALTLGTIAVLR